MCDTQGGALPFTLPPSRLGQLHRRANHGWSACPLCLSSQYEAADKAIQASDYRLDVRLTHSIAEIAAVPGGLTRVITKTGTDLSMRVRHSLR